MASLGFHHGCVIRKQPLNLTVKLPNNQLSASFNPATLSLDSGHRSNLSLSHNGLDLQTKKNHKNNNEIESPRVSENLDEWIQNSVTEIVKNIRHAPLLVQIFADGEMKTKKSLEPKDWKNANNLDGVILVEELPADKFDGSRAYGVLIQGKNKNRNECKSTCYLLKTSSVNNGGLGHVCTHFCLMKVQSFHKKAFEQFRDCWLV